jgi:hypothetical protein
MVLGRKQKEGEEGGKVKRSSRKAASADKRPKSTKSKSTTKKFILIVGDEGAILVFMQGAKVIRRLFAPSARPAHSEAMVELMKANPLAPVSMLMDVMDQQYVPQAFPPVSSLSVGGLVKRRLDRDFQADDFKGALPIGRDAAGRKEWRFLLTALAKTPLVSEWLDCVIELPNELKGIYLVPIEGLAYIAQLGHAFNEGTPSSWQLLFSHNKVSGFRQVVLRNNKLAFTRVSQAIDDAIPAVIAGNIEQEIINTIEYLRRLELSSNADIDATVIVSQDVIDTLDLKRFGFARACAVTPMAVSEKLGLEQAALSADRFGDVVMAAAFAVQKKQVLRFSNAYIDKLAKLYKVRIALRAGAALLVVVLLGLSGMVVADMLGDYARIREVNEKAPKIKADLAAKKKSVGNLDKDIAFKAAVVAAHDAYVKDAPLPEDFIAAMAPLVTPQARVVSLTWDTANTQEKATPETKTAPITIVMEVDFAAVGNTVELVDPVAKAYVAQLTEKLPQYGITAAPFPWQEGEGASGAAAEVDLNAASTTPVKDTKIKLTLSGPKEANAAAAVAPASIPQGAP